MLSLIRTLPTSNNDSAGFHDELYVAKIRNFRGRVTIQNDDVCELTRFERAAAGWLGATFSKCTAIFNCPVRVSSQTAQFLAATTLAISA